MANDITIKSGTNLFATFCATLNQLPLESQNSIREYALKKGIDLEVQAREMNLNAEAAQVDLAALRQTIATVKEATSATVQTTIKGASGTTTVTVRNLNWWGK